VTVSPEIAERLNRYQMSAGDVVLGRRGDVGRCAVVPDSAEGWICGSDSIAIRTDPDSLIPRFLAADLPIDLYRQQLQARSTGVTLANVNEGTLMDLKLPDRSIEDQRRALRTMRTVNSRFEFLANALSRQIDLRAERRQALITAAVTGEIDIPHEIAEEAS